MKNARITHVIKIVRKNKPWTIKTVKYLFHFESRIVYIHFRDKISFCLIYFSVDPSYFHVKENLPFVPYISNKVVSHDHAYLHAFCSIRCSTV